MMNDRFSRLLALCFVLVIASATTGRPAAGQELRIGYPVDIATLDPADHRNRSTEIILRNLYDGLLTRDPLMRLVPDIAEAWTQISPTVYEFKLRDGIMLQSGRPLEADDVVFSFERLIKPGTLGQRSPRASLLGPPIDQLLAYTKTGLKPEEIVTPIVQAFGLGAIAVGVN